MWCIIGDNFGSGVWVCGPFTTKDAAELYSLKRKWVAEVQKMETPAKGAK